jgi:hypothetical protein
MKRVAEDGPGIGVLNDPAQIHDRHHVSHFGDDA